MLKNALMNGWRNGNRRGFEVRLSAFRGELPTSLFRPPWPLCLSFHSWFGRGFPRVCLLLAMN
jgi:hypothetical protein